MAIVQSDAVSVCCWHSMTDCFFFFKVCVCVFVCWCVGTMETANTNISKVKVGLHCLYFFHQRQRSGITQVYARAYLKGISCIHFIATWYNVHEPIRHIIFKINQLRDVWSVHGTNMGRRLTVCIWHSCQGHGTGSEFLLCVWRTETDTEPQVLGWGRLCRHTHTCKHIFVLVHNVPLI